MDWFFTAWGLGIASFATVGMLREIKKGKKLRSEGLTAQGTIVDNKFRLGRVSVFHAVVEFTTIQGQIMRLESQSGISVSTFKKGQNVKVFYDASNPANFMLNSELDLYGPYAVIVLVWLTVASMSFLGMASN
jgi:hypothetical protein